MNSTSRAWVVASSIGAVEALKDQGICRWNYALRCLHQHTKNNLGYFSQVRRSLSSSFAMANYDKSLESEQQMKQSEESLRKVMYLSCWGPN
ncbi:PREDICTED: uncharacterized protein LOC104602184 [Nelumbo nucifera]|uniref:Wound-responsive family protein n=2 Tax=Nelumbo nucifera TaxID=4432 RepID=A0A822YZY5_NELNU|nr:PREDICTED: uncharacterized protein LOC104602184 [Nelumbo nucifera]DAD37011.1 TPA_asm: hypothetical protein HUJ06_007652 [Nelumbo nucifera]